jgi:hypothetical protein
MVVTAPFILKNYKQSSTAQHRCKTNVVQQTVSRTDSLALFYAECQPAQL